MSWDRVTVKDLAKYLVETPILELILLPIYFVFFITIVTLCRLIVAVMWVNDRANKWLDSNWW